jgi:hypothetical protein
VESFASADRRGFWELWCTARMSRITTGLREGDWQPGAMDILLTRVIRYSDPSSQVNMGEPNFIACAEAGLAAPRV